MKTEIFSGNSLRIPAVAVREFLLDHAMIILVVDGDIDRHSTK
jgi:hypothetical protein